MSKQNILICGLEVSILENHFFFFFCRHLQIQFIQFVNRVSLCIDVAPLIKFLNEIEDGTVVMMASFDDSATK